MKPYSRLIVAVALIGRGEAPLHMHASESSLQRRWALLMRRLLFAFAGLSLIVPAVQAQTPTNLRVLYRVLVNGTDRMTTIGSGERVLFPLEGQIYYISQNSDLGSEPLYRMLSFSGTDHADSTISLPGYFTEGILGYPWQGASRPGLSVLYEAINPNTGDHALVRPSESLPDYIGSPLGVYGYPRFGTAKHKLLSLSAGGVTVQSNQVAGGSLWHWFWDGVQYVSTWDYGRQIQSAFCFTNCAANPTEAGDTFSAQFIDPSLRHGSPALRCENRGETQITRSVPLNFDPTVYPGGDEDDPVIWSSMVLGKDLTLDFHGLGPVARYTTHFKLPKETVGTLTTVTAYLRASFNRFWTYDAESGTLTEVTNQMPDACPHDDGYFFAPNFGGIILSDATGDHAMGTYAVNVDVGGSVSYFVLFKYLCLHDGTAETSFDTNVLLVNRGEELFPPGDTTYNAYFVTDKLHNVVAKMNVLYHLGVR